MRDARNRDGFALPVALIAMMVIGAIVTAGFYASSHGRRAAQDVDLDAEALYLAEYGLDQVLGTWARDSVLRALATTGRDGDLGARVVRSGRGELGDYTLRAERLGQELALIRSRGRTAASPSRAEREVGVVVRTTAARLPRPAALTVFGDLSPGDHAVIQGADASAMACASDGAAGLLSDGPVHPADSRASITGDPPTASVPGLTLDGLLEAGTVQVQDLRASATRVYEPGRHLRGLRPWTRGSPDGGPICDVRREDNWGDPSGGGPCGDYRPIVHAMGDLHIEDGRGQGVLLVDGDLFVGGDVEFHGLVVVVGTLNTTGPGNRFVGRVLVQGAGEAGSTTLHGDPTFRYSGCAVRRALDASLRLRPLDRAWLDLSATAGGSEG